MILTRIQIENYKQYSGTHDIEVPAQATIGVIGENGSGKTTLFEAIEWCLYSPRAISASDVRPRSAHGSTTVQVHLESVDGSQRFIVERVLKRSPSATLYRIDESGEVETVVQGTRQVTDYVAAKLIGLSHTAFTATFFTRQKELHLFGDQTPGKRREEVGRLLGLETIRTAQRQFTQERSRAAAEARALAGQYERESQGRDFAAELAAATATIEASGRLLAETAEAIGGAETATRAAEAALARVQARREEDAGLNQRLGELGRERQSIQARLAQVQADLAHLENRARERSALVAIAAQLGDLKQEVARQDAERKRFDLATDLDRRRQHVENRRRDQVQTIRSLVQGIGASAMFQDWRWTDDDRTNPVDGVVRLLGVVNGIDVEGAQRQAQALHAASDAAQRLAEAESILAKYQASRAQIEKEADDLVRDGDPSDRLPGLDRDRESLLEARTIKHAARTTLEGQRDSTLQILGNLEKQQFGETCPTCGRPFSDTDGAVVILSLRERIEGLTQEIEQSIAGAADIDEELRQLDLRKEIVFAQIDKLAKVRARIDKSVNYLDNQRESVDRATNALKVALANASLVGPPDTSDLATADAAARTAQILDGTRTQLASAKAALIAFRDDEANLVAQRRSLGDVAFDQEAYQALIAACQKADIAQATIAQIDQQLARKPEYEAARDTAALRITELDEGIAAATAQRTVLGYDPAELATAQATVTQAREAERNAVAAYHRSQADLRHAETQRDLVAKERDRLAQLAKDADARQTEAGYLELMAKEFTEFERFAAARKVPVLGEYTSALVRSITDGRYERVEFDQDFGIVVYDGEDTESSYAVDSFSGGERDAITLAARIALSQMIGRQAAHPPGFLVLDEVFGSLDSDRRAHLLDLLGSISTTFDELRQVFIISHVDDVRTSPVLDELWRVEETEEGASQVMNLRPGTDIDSI